MTDLRPDAGAAQKSILTPSEAQTEGQRRRPSSCAKANCFSPSCRPSFRVGALTVWGRRAAPRRPISLLNSRCPRL